MVACVTPSSLSQEHTLSTLRYASRARSIKNQLRRNDQVSPAEEIAFLKAALIDRDAIISQLQKENAMLKRA